MHRLALAKLVCVCDKVYDNVKLRCQRPCQSKPGGNSSSTNLQFFSEALKYTSSDSAALVTLRELVKKGVNALKQHDLASCRPMQKNAQGGALNSHLLKLSIRHEGDSQYRPHNFAEFDDLFD